jgi:hypothetical protein
MVRQIWPPLLNAGAPRTTMVRHAEWDRVHDLGWRMTNDDDAGVPDCPGTDAPMPGPASDTPVIETPAAEAPVIEPPVTEMPAAEPPLAEAPMATAPMMETSAAAMPAGGPLGPAPVADPAMAEGPVFGAPAPRRSRRKLWLALAGAVLAVVLIAVGYSVVRLLLDNSAYHDGHEAYRQADCAAAVGRFDAAISGWRLVTLGDTVTRAETEKAECLPFRDAADQERAGNGSGAVVSYVRFLSGRPESPLTQAAQNRITGLLGRSDLAALATIDSCGTLPALRERKLIPPATAPAFHAACGTAYANKGDWAQAAKTYALLFTDFAQDKVAADTETAMIADTNWCIQLDKIRNDAVLAARGDLLPGLLLTCAKSFATSAVTTAIEDAEEFLRKFPGHRLTGEMTATFAQLLNQQTRADTEAKDFGGIEQIGSPGGDKAVIMIYNDSPEIMRVALAGGPEPRVEEIAACPTCPANTTGGRTICRENIATLKRLVLPPGEYDFSSDHPQDPATIGSYGHWSLKPGKQYFICIGITKATP